MGSVKPPARRGRFRADRLIQCLPIRQPVPACLPQGILDRCSPPGSASSALGHHSMNDASMVVLEQVRDEVRLPFLPRP